MKKNTSPSQLIRVLSLIIIVLLLLNLVLFALRKLSILVFWIILLTGALAAFVLRRYYKN